MGEAGEFTLHPQELAGVLFRFFFAVGDVDLLQIAAVLWPRLIADLTCDVIVEFPDVLGRFNRGVERDIGIALLGRPNDGLLAQHPRNPHPRIRLLQRHRPRVDDAVLVMRALPAEWPLPRPSGDNQVVRLLEALAVVGRANTVCELLLTA